MDKSNLSSMLTSAIAEGAPRYNMGDVAGCAMIYLRTCEAAAQLASGEVRTELMRAGDDAKRLRAARRDDEAAWLLRRAFDALLTRPVGLAQTSINAALEMKRAIQAGVPMFNSGDVTSCAALYEKCCRDVVAVLSGEPQSRMRKVLAQLPNLRSSSERAWALRHAMDFALSSSGGGGGGGGKYVGGDSEGNPGQGGGKEAMVVDFTLPATAAAWRPINDGVMGGRSQSSMRAEGGAGVFEGSLSTQNGGGFASVRGPAVSGSLRGFQGLRITFRGDGGRYKLLVRTSDAFDGVMYQADFDSAAGGGGGGGEGGWEERSLRFDQFVPSWRGSPVPSAPALAGEAVRSLGLMVSKLTDRGAANPSFRPGPFRLDVRRVTAF